MGVLKRATFLAAAAATSTAFGVEFRFGTSTSSNPTIYADQGQYKTVTLYARRSSATGYVNHVSLNVLSQSTNASTVMGSLSVLNLYRGSDPLHPDAIRWDDVTFGFHQGTGSALVMDCNTVSGTETPGLSIGGDWADFASFRVAPTGPGIFQVFLQVGPQGISETGGATTSTLGWGDAPVPNTPGAISSLADLTIVSPAPEPGTVGLLGVAGVLMPLSRRRRR